MRHAKTFKKSAILCVSKRYFFERFQVNKLLISPEIVIIEVGNVFVSISSSLTFNCLVSEFHFSSFGTRLCRLACNSFLRWIVTSIVRFDFTMQSRLCVNEPTKRAKNLIKNKNSTNQNNQKAKDFKTIKKKKISK